MPRNTSVVSERARQSCRHTARAHMTVSGQWRTGSGRKTLLRPVSCAKRKLEFVAAGCKREPHFQTNKHAQAGLQINLRSSFKKV